MARVNRKRRAYSPKRAKMGASKRSPGAAAFKPLIETKLRGKGSGSSSAKPVAKTKRATPAAFSEPAIEASREADIRHRKARRNAKSRSGRLFFS